MILFSPLSAGIMQSCHCPSPLQGSPVWLEQCFNPIPLCVQFPSFQPSQSNLTPRLPTPLMRTSPLNVKPEETPSPREYWSSKQRLSLLLTFAKHCCVCQELLHKTCSSSSVGSRFGFPSRPFSFCCSITSPHPVNRYERGFPCWGMFHLSGTCQIHPMV